MVKMKGLVEDWVVCSGAAAPEVWDNFRERSALVGKCLAFPELQLPRHRVKVNKPLGTNFF
jgi:hypothetical protein